MSSRRRRHPGSARKHRALASACSFCELTLIRQIRPRTAEACHGKEVGRPPTRGAPQLPPSTNSQPAEKNNNLIAAPSQPLTLPDTSKDEGKNRKGDGQQRGNDIEVPSHGAGGHKRFRIHCEVRRRSSQVFPPEVQHRSSTRSARDHMFALVAGSTRATTTFCASTTGVLAWSAIPEHGHSTTSSESWPGSSTAPAKRRSPMYVKPCSSIRRICWLSQTWTTSQKYLQRRRPSP